MEGKMKGEIPMAHLRCTCRYRFHGDKFAMRVDRKSPYHMLGDRIQRHKAGCGGIPDHPLYISECRIQRRRGHLRRRIPHLK